MSKQLMIEAEQIVKQLKSNNDIIKNIVFCNNCQSAHDCYMYSVFSMIGLKCGYCAAGVAKENKIDDCCLALIEALSNIDLVNPDLVTEAKSKLREQKRILKHYTHCKDCDNHNCCDAEDTMTEKNIKKPYCCVGSTKVR